MTAVSGASVRKRKKSGNSWEKSANCVWARRKTNAGDRHCAVLNLISLCYTDLL